MTVQICKGRLINRHFTYYYAVKSVNICKGYLWLYFEDRQIEKIRYDENTEYLIS